MYAQADMWQMWPHSTGFIRRGRCPGGELLANCGVLEMCKGLRGLDIWAILPACLRASSAAREDRYHYIGTEDDTVAPR